MVQCYRHPKVETNLACGRCERPICIKCSIPGPVGMRCPDCSALRSSPLYKVSPGRLALAAILGLIAGTVGAAILFSVGFFVVLIGPAYGGAVAEIVLRVSGRKRGSAIEAIGVGSIVAGALAAIAGTAASALHAATAAGAPVSFSTLLISLVPSLIWPLVGVALAVSTCFSRLRYF